MVVVLGKKQMVNSRIGVFNRGCGSSKGCSLNCVSKVERLVRSAIVISL